MADHCMIIAGEWKTSGDGSWNFSIDKHQMSRIVTLSPSMTLVELQNNVMKEFFPNTQTRPEASLSYWPSKSKELATGISTPPVMLTHDGSVCFFYRHFELQKGMNLFVTFNHQSDPINTSQVAENLFPFSTPNQPITNPPPLYSTVIPVLVPLHPDFPRLLLPCLKSPDFPFSLMMIYLEAALLSHLTQPTALTQLLPRSNVSHLLMKLFFVAMIC